MSARVIFCAAMTLILWGCQTAAHVGNENSPYYVVPAGSRVTLNQALTIPPDELAVYVQNGRVLRNAEVVHDLPFCKFELRDLSRAARTVQPEEMEVTRSARARSRGVTAALGGLQLASSDDLPSIESYSTQMDLRSNKQPDIFRLTCARWGTPGQVQHVSIADMRRTLAGVFSLRLPSEGTAGRS